MSSLPTIRYTGEISDAEKVAALKAEVLRLSTLVEAEELEKQITAINAKAAAVAEDYSKQIEVLVAAKAAAAEQFSNRISVLLAKKTSKKGYRPRAELSPEELALARQRDNANKKRLREAAKAAKAATSPSSSPSSSPKRTLTPEHLAAMKAGREAAKAARAAPVPVV